MEFNPSYQTAIDGHIHLTEEDCVNNRELIEEIFYEHAMKSRLGMGELLEWLANCTDFYVAPCSTVYHLCTTGGLALHSLKVYEIFDKLCDIFHPSFPASSRAICALLHDTCKTNTYRTAIKSRKTGELWPNGKAKWEDYVGYEFDDKFPYGHGEKSVYLIMNHIGLTPEEAMAIRWHMGGYDDTAKSNPRPLGNACNLYRAVSLLHSADLIATSMGF